MWSSTSTLFSAATITLIVASPSYAEQNGAWFGNGVDSEAVIATWPDHRNDYEIFVSGIDHKLWQIKANDQPLRNEDWVDLGAPGHPGESPIGITGKPTVVTWDDKQIDVFARGREDDALWHIYYDGKSWQPWKHLDGILAADPVAIRRPEVDATLERTGAWFMDVFVRGTDNELYLLEFDGQTWSKFRSLGGNLAGAPKVVSWGQGRVDIFAQSTDGALLHSFLDPAFDRDVWQPFKVVAGSEDLQPFSPEVITQEPNRIDVFAVQQDGAVSHHSLRDGTWKPAATLGGSVTSTPTIVSWEPGRFDAFARGSDGTLQHAYFVTGWSKWKSLGGNLGERPAAIAPAKNRFELITVDEQRNIYRRRYDDGKWSP